MRSIMRAAIAAGAMVLAASAMAQVNLQGGGNLGGNAAAGPGGADLGGNAAGNLGGNAGGANFGANAAAGAGLTVAPADVSPTNPFGTIDIAGAGNTTASVAAYSNTLSASQRAELGARCAVIATSPSMYSADASAFCLAYGNTGGAAR